MEIHNRRLEPLTDQEIYEAREDQATIDFINKPRENLIQAEVALIIAEHKERQRKMLLAQTVRMNFTAYKK